MKDASRREHGFSFIELVIVIAVVGILTALTIPVLGSVQHNARMAVVQATAQGAYTQGIAAIEGGADFGSVEGRINAQDERVAVTLSQTGAGVCASASWVDTSANVPRSDVGRCDATGGAARVVSSCPDFGAQAGRLTTFDSLLAQSLASPDRTVPNDGRPASLLEAQSTKPVLFFTFTRPDCSGADPDLVAAWNDAVVEVRNATTGELAREIPHHSNRWNGSASFELPSFGDYVMTVKLDSPFALADADEAIIAFDVTADTPFARDGFGFTPDFAPMVISGSPH